MICAIVIAVLFMNGSALGLKTMVDKDSENYTGSDYFTDNDLRGDWDMSSFSTKITLKQDSAKVVGKVQAQGIMVDGLGVGVQCSGPENVIKIEERISNGNGLLADNGASRSNLFSGDTDNVIFTLSKISDVQKLYNKAWFSVFSNPSNFARIIVLFFWEMLRRYHGIRLVCLVTSMSSLDIFQATILCLKQIHLR